MVQSDALSLAGDLKPMNIQDLPAQVGWDEMVTAHVSDATAGAIRAAADRVMNGRATTAPVHHMNFAQRKRWAEKFGSNPKGNNPKPTWKWIKRHK